MSPSHISAPASHPWRLMVAASLGTLLLAACGGSSEPADDAPSPDETSQSEPADTASEPTTDEDSPATNEGGANPGWRVTGALDSDTFTFSGSEISSCEPDSDNVAIEASADGGSISITGQPGAAVMELTLKGTTWSSEGVPSDAVPFDLNGSTDTLTARGTLVSSSGETLQISVNAICLTLDEE